MVQTFYRTEHTLGDPRAEYYSLELRSLPVGFSVTEYHGWWDDEQKKALLNWRILNTAEEPLSHADALRIYDEQKQYLLAQNFDQQYETDYEGLRGPAGDLVHTDLSKKKLNDPTARKKPD
jgi:hypothetical protein